MAKQEEKKKTKRPTAEKRDIRNEKRRMINKSFKTSVRTAMRSFEEAVKGEEKDQAQEKLCSVYSTIDKGVKRGLYSQNKANRIKSRATKKISA